MGMLLSLVSSRISRRMGIYLIVVPYIPLYSIQGHMLTRGPSILTQTMVLGKIEVRHREGKKERGSRRRVIGNRSI